MTSPDSEKGSRVPFPFPLPLPSPWLAPPTHNANVDRQQRASNALSSLAPSQCNKRPCPPATRRQIVCLQYGVMPIANTADPVRLHSSRPPALPSPIPVLHFARLPSLTQYDASRSHVHKPLSRPAANDPARSIARARRERACSDSDTSGPTQSESRLARGPGRRLRSATSTVTAIVLDRNRRRGIPHLCTVHTYQERTYRSGSRQLTSTYRRRVCTLDVQYMYVCARNPRPPAPYVIHHRACPASLYCARVSCVKREPMPPPLGGQTRMIFCTYVQVTLQREAHRHRGTDASTALSE